VLAGHLFPRNHHHDLSCIRRRSGLATTTGIKTTGAATYGFSTSAKAQALIDLVVSMRAALVTAGIGV
jgi:hypothetical protein